MTAPELVTIDLTDDERQLLVLSMNEYFGAARKGWPLLIPLLGLSTPDEFRVLVDHLMDALEYKSRCLISIGRVLCF
jgi:hypothetical protein